MASARTNAKGAAVRRGPKLILQLGEPTVSFPESFHVISSSPRWQFNRVLAPEHACELLASSSAIRLDDVPPPGQAAGRDDVLVGRIRRDTAGENGLSLFIACDNLRKGAALNAIQIAELLLARQPLAA